MKDTEVYIKTIHVKWKTKLIDIDQANSDNYKFTSRKFWKK